jgi:ATP-binding cassette, subfamily B, bacterial MsbA
MSEPSILRDSDNRDLILRVLRENFHLYLRRYIIAFALMAVTAVATGLSVFLMKDVVKVVFTPAADIKPADASVSAGKIPWVNDILNAAFSHLQPGMLLVIGVAVSILIVFAAKGLAHYGSNVILSKIGNNIVARQQHRLGNHILDQPPAFFVHFPSSDLITRTSRSSNAAREVMNLLMMRVQDVLTAIALIGTMFFLDWRLAAGALFIMSPVVILLGKIIRRIRKVAKAEFHQFIRITTAIQEAILGNRLIKSYTLENHMRDRLENAITGVEQRANKLAIVAGRTSPIMEFMGGLAIAFIVIYGGHRNLVQGESAESLIAFLTALLLAYEPIKRIARMNVSLQASLVGVRMLYEVLDADHSLTRPANPAALEVTAGQVELKEITFSYQPGQPVLRDVSLICPGGTVTALVGPSGSGKSTVLNLIERFYEPEAGQLSIDGQDVASLDLRSLRGRVALVSQDTFLFSDTIRNNIRIVRPDANDAEVEAAARSAYIHDFISKQPEGYETLVGENGTNLSGGQRQRISIARAFLKNAPILLLDEATSALDSESEQKIQAAFDELMKGRTTIVIAHRFSTIRNARLIHVMQNGRLVASGTHDQLIADPDGLYAHLSRLQYEQGTTP